MTMLATITTPADIKRKAGERRPGLLAIAVDDHQTRLEEAVRSPKRLPDELERNRFVTPAQAAEFSGFSLPHIRRLYRTGQMPPPICLSGRKLGWKLGTLLAWVDAAPQTTIHKAA